MSDGGRRVALLARPGAALDNVRGALLEIGAEIVCEGDPTKATPQSVRESTPDVLMIVLDAVSEGALDRFDSMLGDPSIEVMFEEADVAAGRDGWEAARWRRHLSAKLGHRSDVLPPFAGADLVPATDALSISIESLATSDDADFPAPAQATLPPDIAGGSDFSVFDPAAAEAFEGGTAGAEHVLSVHGLELDASALDGSLPAAGGLEFDDSAFANLPPLGDHAFDAGGFDPLHAEFDAVLSEASGSSAPAVADPEWSAGSANEFAAVQADAPAESASRPVPPPLPPALPPAGFGELSLVDDAAPANNGPASGAARRHDLGELERRIASLELVDDAAPNGDRKAPPSMDSHDEPAGAVLVLAGIGGPDAVRQLLAALPKDFPRAVLVRQRLDVSRYDKLVAQLQRASPLPVALATPGDAVRAGHVYVLGDDIGLADGGMTFTSGGDDCLVGRLAPTESAVIVLSGADAGQTDAIAALILQGAFVGAQAADGCYDAAAATALAARGASTAPPAELAAQLVGRWVR